jgi:hypothetical protein
MTPEEIVKEFANAIVISPPMALRAKSKAIEAIKAYAREMCDKQKLECISNLSETSEDFSVQDLMVVTGAPYPKELQ